MASSIKPYCDGAHAQIGFSDAKDAKRVPTCSPSYVSRRSGTRLRSFASLNPIWAWAPSQYGLMDEAPHRHRAISGRDGNGSPSQLMKRAALLTRSGPFGESLIAVGASPVATLSLSNRSRAIASDSAVLHIRS